MTSRWSVEVMDRKQDRKVTVVDDDIERMRGLVAFSLFHNPALRDPDLKVNDALQKMVAEMDKHVVSGGVSTKQFELRWWRADGCDDEGCPHFGTPHSHESSEMELADEQP